MRIVILMVEGSVDSSVIKNRLCEEVKKKHSGVRIADWRNTYMDFKVGYDDEHVRLILKRINIKRPADLYKYPDDAEFIYIRGTAINRIDRKMQELESLLVKKRDFIELSSIGEVVAFLKNDTKVTYYEIGERYELIKKQSYKRPFNNLYPYGKVMNTDDYDKALAYRNDYIRQKSTSVRKELEEKERELRYLSSLLSD